jgi:hypothetical protein
MPKGFILAAAELPNKTAKATGKEPGILFVFKDGFAIKPISRMPTNTIFFAYSSGERSEINDTLIARKINQGQLLLTLGAIKLGELEDYPVYAVYLSGKEPALFLALLDEKGKKCACGLAWKGAKLLEPAHLKKVFNLLHDAQKSSSERIRRELERIKGLKIEGTVQPKESGLRRLFGF